MPPRTRKNENFGIFSRKFFLFHPMMCYTIGVRLFDPAIFCKKGEVTMQVTGNKYLTEILYKSYQQNQEGNIDETLFARLVMAAKGDTNSSTDPAAQVWSDYLNWKAAQPERALPESRGATEENIAYLREHFSGKLDLFQRLDAADTMVEMGIVSREELMEALGLGKLELRSVPLDSKGIICTGAVANSRYMPAWSSFFAYAPVMQSDSLEDLFKLLDEQMKNSREKDAAQEIKDVLEQVARRSFGANWAVV